MNAKHLLPCLTALAIALSATAYSQVRPGVGPTSPNRQNQDLDTAQKIQLMDDQRRLEDLRRRDAQSKQSEQGSDGDPARDPAVVRAQVARFMEAIKRRRNRFADFDSVVIHGKTPMTPEMLGFIAESRYAADIAYYLGKHPEQSGAIAQMLPDEAGPAVRQLASTIAAENGVRE
jgi:hypothetical protein